MAMVADGGETACVDIDLTLTPQDGSQITANGELYAGRSVPSPLRASDYRGDDNCSINTMGQRGTNCTLGACRFHKTPLIGRNYQLSTVPGLEFEQQVTDMSFKRIGRDIEHRHNLTIG